MTNVPAKKKRVSKKKKSSWRKHVDISDVDKFLEDQRRDERIGNLELVANNDLFVLDTGLKPKALSKQEKRLLLRSAPIKCHSALKPLNNVPDPITKRNRVRTKEERQATMLRIKTELKNREKGILKKSELKAIHNRKCNAEKSLKSKRKQKYEFQCDIWGADESILRNTPVIDIAVKDNQWITGDTERHLLHGEGKPVTETPKCARKTTSFLEPVSVPHPGMSYNPSFEDHQDLLMKVVEKEKKLIKEEAHINRVTKDIFKKISAKEKESNWLEEMSQGLPKPSDPVEEASDNEYKSVNPPVRNKKKSLKQRRKQREQLALELARRKAKEEKKKIADIHKLRFIKKELEKEDEKSKILHERKLYAEERKKTEAKRLGLVKFEEPDLEFNMGNEISGNLRNMKSDGNMLLERFKSMQKRNLIQPTLIRTRKKAKVKEVTRPGYKDDWKQTIARPGFLKK